MNFIKSVWKDAVPACKTFVKWVGLGLLSGVLAGSCATVFYYALSFVTSLRMQYSWLLYLLPAAGLFIVFLYQDYGASAAGGTNLVLRAIREEGQLPVRMAPLIALCTCLTHLCGGSAGREGATLQLGGSIAGGLGKWLKLSASDRQILIMSGMSAAFSAVFGTPLAAAVFSMEVVTVGHMYYSAMVPCTLASFIASDIARSAGVVGEAYALPELPEFATISSVWVVVLAALCAGLSVLFCITLHSASRAFKKWIPNEYLRVAAGGAFVILLTLLLGTDAYLGAGIPLIEQAMAGQVRPEAFLLKMIFTVVTLAVGFKGGEIVPSFVIGATFGCLFGQLAGLEMALCAAIGMTAFFCGVTNSPLTSLVIAAEMFGFSGAPYFLLAASVSYLLSGYHSLYRAQKIVCSKFERAVINRSIYEDQEFL